MKITKQRLSQIVKEELAHQSIGASRSPEEVFASVDESLNQAHKDLQMLSLHLKNGGFDTQPVEKILKDVENDIINLNGLVKEDVENLVSQKGTTR